MSESTIVAITQDPLVTRNLTRVAAQMGLQLVMAGSFDELFAVPQPPLAVVIELEMDEALETVERCVQQWSLTLVAGFVRLPTNERWLAAEKAGCHLVATRGAFVNQFQKRVQGWQEQPGGRRFPLFGINDLAGRLGLVQRLPESPVGPLAIYHIGGVVYAAEDVCPHGQATLSEGELNMEGAIITCPLHGSQFDVRTGERTRGPSDQHIKTYQVGIEGTQVFLQLD